MTIETVDKKFAISKVKLTKIESNHNNLRTNEVIGMLLGEPQVGYIMALIADSLENTDPDSQRYIRTTRVEKIEGNRVWTKNSIYDLEYL